MIALKVPPLGESIVEATISRWRKQEGEAVAAGETVVELDTDKITVEVPALKAGVLARRAKNEGDVVKVDEILGEIDETKSGAASKPSGSGSAGAQAVESGSAGLAVPNSGTIPTGTTQRGADVKTPAAAEPRSSPAARRTAEEKGTDISSVRGTGRGGVISKPDVVEHSAGARAAAAPSAPSAGSGAGAATGPRETREKMSVRRKKIAEHLLEAQHATAHLTTFNEIDMSAVMSLRDRLKERVEKEHGAKLTFMPFFVKAACVALRSHPVLNAQIDGDTVVYKHYVNMGIAVASEDGLVVPVIREADSKGMIQISRDIVDIAGRARDRKLALDDLMGGTFTITNGGVFGSLVSTPILNYPQVGILGLHKIEERVVVLDGKMEIRPMMYVALSYDHRIVDGQQSVLFLVRVKQLMEDPAAMLVD